MLEDPELVTLLPEDEEEPPPPISEELDAVGRIIVDVALLIGLKVAMVIVSRRLAKNVRALNKPNFPHQRANS